MEGLIPLVIHAIKRRRDRNSYRCLSRGSRSLRMHHLPNLELAEPEPELELEPAELGDDSFYHRHPPHRRTQSELPAFAPPDPRSRIGPSRSLRAAVFFPARSSDGAAA